MQIDVFYVYILQCEVLDSISDSFVAHPTATIYVTSRNQGLQ